MKAREKLDALEKLLASQERGHLAERQALQAARDGYAGELAASAAKVDELVRPLRSRKSGLGGTEHAWRPRLQRCAGS